MNRLTEVPQGSPAADERETITKWLWARADLLASQSKSANDRYVQRSRALNDVAFEIEMSIIRP